jgi:hypothetical protein
MEGDKSSRKMPTTTAEPSSSSTREASAADSNWPPNSMW